MPELNPTIPQRQQFARYLLSAYRELKSVYPGGYESFLVAMSAAMGNRHTGKPVNVSSIAQMTGIPRPTVVRKLLLLEEMGMASRTETRKETLIYMSPESWDHVRPHVARLLVLGSDLATA